METRVHDAPFKGLAVGAEAGAHERGRGAPRLELRRGPGPARDRRREERLGRDDRVEVGMGRRDFLVMERERESFF